MARRRHRRRRGFGDYVSVPSFGSIKDYNPLGKSVKSTDVFVGAALGIAGGSLVKMGLGKLDVATGGKVPQFVKDYIGPISTLLAGVALFVFQKKRNHGRAQGHLIGATLAAAAPLYWDTLKKAAPDFFNDYVTVSPYGVLTRDAGSMGGYGVLTADGAMSGFAADDDYPDVLSAP
jgi:hypothetical protein